MIFLYIIIYCIYVYMRLLFPCIALETLPCLQYHTAHAQTVTNCARKRGNCFSMAARCTPHTHIAPPSPDNIPHSVGLHREGKMSMCVFVFVKEKGVDGPLRRGDVTTCPSFPGCPRTGDKMRAEMDYVHPELRLKPRHSHSIIRLTH